MTAPCTENTASLLAARDFGVLEASESAELDAHLATCASCKDLPAAIASATSDLALDKETAPDVWKAIEHDLDRQEAVAPQVALGCTYCKDQLVREESVFCAKCLAPHHEECFVEHGRCSACRERRFVHPSAPVARPFTRRVAAPLLLVAIGAGAAVAALQLVSSGPAKRPASRTATAPPLGSATPPPPGRPGPAPTKPNPSPPTPDDEVSLDVTDTDLERLLLDKVIPTESRDTIAVERGLGVRVSGRFAGYWRSVLRELVAQGDCELHEAKESNPLSFVTRKRPVVTLPGATLGEAAAAIASASGRTVIVDPRCAGTKVADDLSGQSWWPFLEGVARANGLVVRAKSDVIVVSPNRSFKWGAPLSTSERWRYTARWSKAPSAPERTGVHLTGTLSLDDWAELIVQATGKTIVVPGATDTMLSLDVRDSLDADDALDIVLAFRDLGVASDSDDTVRVGPLAKTVSLDVKRSVALARKRDATYLNLVFVAPEVRLHGVVEVPTSLGATVAQLSIRARGTTPERQLRLMVGDVVSLSTPEFISTLRLARVSAGQALFEGDGGWRDGPAVHLELTPGAAHVPVVRSPASK